MPKPVRLRTILKASSDHAVYRAEREEVARDFRDNGFSLGLICSALRVILNLAYYRTMFGTAELGMDLSARVKKIEMWLHGLARGGLQAAADEAAGLGVTA